MIKKHFMFLLLVTVCKTAFPQDNHFKEVIPRTPNAASLGKYGDVPVSYHTGVPDITIPIYTLQEGPLSLPISLSYHGSGIPTDEVSSWVGLGWSLQAGGMISRTIRGARDEGGVKVFGGPEPHKTAYSPKAGWGWYKNYGMPAEIANPYVCNPAFGYPNSNINSDGNSACHYFYYDAANGFLDSEPDLFTFNAAGAAGKFVFDENRVPYTFPWQDYYIKPINYNESQDQFFDEFLIIAPDGTKYFFGGLAATEKSYVSTNGLFFITVPYNSSTTWYLYKIESADAKHWINLVYTPENYSITNRLSHSVTIRYGNQISGDEVNAPALWMVSNIKGMRLSQINVSSGNVVIDFHPSTQFRQDLSKFLFPGEANNEAKSLAKISIYNPSGLCKEYVLGTDYFQSAINSAGGQLFQGAEFDTKRLRLNAIQEVSCDASIKVPPHEFFYNTTPMARRLSLAKDFWGFYNGADANKGLIPNGIAHPYSSLPLNGGANRYVSETHLKAWSLDRIKYPTGGEVLFLFEANRYPFGTGESLAGGLRIKQITKKFTQGPDIVTDYEYGTTRLFTEDPNFLSSFFVKDPYSNSTLRQFEPLVVTEYGVILDASPPSPIYSTQGTHIGYYNVKEKRSDNSYKEYVFEGDVLFAIPYFPGVPTQNPIGKGALRDTKIISSSGHTVAYTSNEYSRESEVQVKIINAKKVGSVHTYFCPTGSICDDVRLTHGAPLDYQLRTFRHSLKGQTEKLDEVTTVSSYEYDATNKHGNPVRVSKTTSEGKTLEIENVYPSDTGSGAPAQMYDPLNANYKHMLGIQIESREKTDGLYTKKASSTYSYNTSLNIVQLTSSRIHPRGGTDFIEHIYNYDNDNNIIDVKKTNDVGISYIWDYNESYPIAKVINASQDQIAYTSFEADGKGNWSFTPNIASGTFVTGFHAQNLSSAIQKTGLTPTSTYKISYWHKNGTVSLSSQPVANSTVTYTDPDTGWTFWEGSFTGITSLSITGSGIIDELRLYPHRAQMTTYTYKPSLGITSTTDPNNVTAFYLYDNLGRLKTVKDNKGNIVKNYQYHFKGQN